MRRYRRVRALTALCTTMLVAACSSDAGGSEPASGSDASSRAVTPILEQDEGSVLSPGRYAVPFVGLPLDRVHAEVDVPQGFEPYHGSFLWQGSDDDPSHALSFWHITGVNPDPCDADYPQYRDPGSTVADLEQALRRQPHRQVAEAGDVELAGHQGRYLELTLPANFDPERCVTGSYEAWEAVDPETGQTYPRYQYGPGYVDQLWVLDVDGETLVVNATFDPGILQEDMSALEDMVDSVSIDAAE